MGALFSWAASVGVESTFSGRNYDGRPLRSAKPREIDWHKLYASLKRIPKRFHSPYTNFYAEGASRLGWKVEVMSRSKSVALLHPKKKSKGDSVAPVLVRRHKLDILCNRFCAKIFSSKFQTHKKMMEHGFPCPETIFIQNTDMIPVIHVNSKNGPFVVKPVEGSQGKGVHMGIRTKKELLGALNSIWKKDKVACLVQEQVYGNDYRVLILRGAILDIVERVPAYVTGNGVDSTDKLVTLENKRRKACELPLLVKADPLGPFTDIPTLGERRVVQDKANVSLGGIPVRYPIERVHAKNIKLFNNIAATFPEQPMIGIDFLGNLAVPWQRPCRKPTGTQAKYSGVILELNSTPQMFCHTLRGNHFNLTIVQTILQEAAKTAKEARAKRKARRRGAGLVAKK